MFGHSETEKKIPGCPNFFLSFRIFKMESKKRSGMARQYKRDTACRAETGMNTVHA